MSSSNAFMPKIATNGVKASGLKASPMTTCSKGDKVDLDIFWLGTNRSKTAANLPDPDVLALEIAEELEAALEQFAAIAEDLKR
jgi:hypothetical protein